MQVYDKFNILTNKPKTKDLKNGNCKLFGFINYPDKCNVGLWRNKSIELLKDKKKIPIFVGGTGLYLESLTKNISEIPQISKKVKLKVNKIMERKGKQFLYDKLIEIDKNYAKKISSNDTQRILRAIEVKVATGKSFSEWHGQEKKNIFEKIIYVVVSMERDLLYDKINSRCKEMLKRGVIDEVEDFLDEQSDRFHPLHKAIGLNPISLFILGKMNKDECISIFMQDTRRYAKRQLTWFNNRASYAKHLGFFDAENYILNSVKI